MSGESLKGNSELLEVGSTMDNFGIEEELKAELEELKKSSPIQEVVSLEVGFFLSSEKPLIISGVALAEGIWKNTIYSAEELKKACQDLIGKPVKVEHGNDKEFGDKIVGKVVHAEWDELLKAIKFKAEITDPKAIEYIKKERFKAVSMSTWMEKVSVGVGELKVGQNFRFVELSLVENPACEKCFIFHFEQLAKIEKCLKESNKEELVGEKVMSEENSVKELLIAICEDGDFIEEVQLSSENELEELKKTKKVVAYYYYSPYYGYPYPYYPYGYPYYGYPYYGYPYYGYPGYGYPYYGYLHYGYPKKVKKKAKKSTEEKKAFAKLVVDSGEELEIFEFDSEEDLKKELENARAAKKKIIAYYYYPSQYYGYGYPYYGYYGYPYYGYYPYGYPYYPYEPMKEEEESLPFEETEETIKCRACGKEFSNFRDFIAHWVKEHRKKYGPYKPAIPYYGYPEYGYPEAKKSDFLEDQSEDEDILATGYKIVFNKRNKKWIVFEVPEKGLWKIAGVFDTEEEAKAFIEKQKEKCTENTEKPEEEKASETSHEEKKNEENKETKELAPQEEKTTQEVNSEPLLEEKKGGEEKMEEKKEEPQVTEEKKEEKVEVKPEPVQAQETPKETKTEEVKEEPKVEPEPKVESKAEPKIVPEPEQKEEKITVEDILRIIKEQPEVKRLILEKWFEERKTR